MTIKNLRSSARMTQKEFSEYFGIPKRSIENWESGQRKCPEYLQNLMEYKLKKERMIFMKKYIDETGKIVEAANYEEAAKKLYGEEFYQNPAYTQESILSTLSLDWALPITVRIYAKGSKRGYGGDLPQQTHVLKPYKWTTTVDFETDFVFENTPIRLEDEADFEYRSDTAEPNNYICCVGYDCFGNKYDVYYYVSDEEMESENWEICDIDFTCPTDIVLREEN